MKNAHHRDVVAEAVANYEWRARYCLTRENESDDGGQDAPISNMLLIGARRRGVKR
jgi:hypothetical protein